MLISAFRKKQTCRKLMTERNNSRGFILNHKYSPMKTTHADTLIIRSNDLLKASFLFEAIVHPMRRRLVEAVLEEEGLTATALSQKLEIEQGLCLQQLSILCGVGLLLRRREGRQIVYVVDQEKIEALNSAAGALLHQSFE